MDPTNTVLEPTRSFQFPRRDFLVSFVVATAATLASRGIAAADSPLPSTAAWQDVIKSMFPHSDLNDSFYAVTAGALTASAEKDPATRQLLSDGWQELSRNAGGDWLKADRESRNAAVAAIVGSPLFSLLRQTTVFTLYANPEVWAKFGYEGDAWRFGGYAGDSLVTIDWLPDPPAVGRGR